MKSNNKIEDPDPVADNTLFPATDPGSHEEEGSDKAHDPGLIRADPVKSATDKDIFTREEKTKFLRAINSLEDLIFIRLGLYGGLRISEILNLEYQDIIQDPGIPPILHIRASKRNKYRYAHIDPATIQIILAQGHDLGDLPDHPDRKILKKSIRTYNRRFQEILIRSGITRITPSPHTLRHTNITMLLEGGMDILEVMDHCGHSEVRYTQIYTHLTYRSRSRSYDQVIGE